MMSGRKDKDLYCFFDDSQLENTSKPAIREIESRMRNTVNTDFRNYWKQAPTMPSKKQVI